MICYPSGVLRDDRCIRTSISTGKCRGSPGELRCFSNSVFWKIFFLSLSPFVMIVIWMFLYIYALNLGSRMINSWSSLLWMLRFWGTAFSRVGVILPPTGPRLSGISRFLPSCRKSVWCFFALVFFLTRKILVSCWLDLKVILWRWWLWWR